MQNESLARKLKKHIYAKPQAIRAIFPAGLGAVAYKEVEGILVNLWFSQKFNSEVALLKNEIRITNIHMFAVVELLLRSRCLSDLRLVIFEGKTIGIKAFEQRCKKIDWILFINKSMRIRVKVDSVASQAFHETALKEILNKVLSEYTLINNSQEEFKETTSLYAELYKDRLTISISLAGAPLYKRGYRGILGSSAPLREDMAACCIREALQFVKKQDVDFIPETVFIPFSGTGTFAFEFFLEHFSIAPGLLGRKYAIEQMPLFRREHFNYILLKAKENCLLTSESFLEAYKAMQFNCIDHSSSANKAFIENIEIFKNSVLQHNFDLPKAMIAINKINDEIIYLKNFIAMEVDEFFNNQNIGNIFMPLNPPYGLRLGKTTSTATLYMQIANQINKITRLTKKENKNLLGFILCPNEESWRSFCDHLYAAKIDTYHFTQGGLDIRVCQFYI